MRAAQPETSEIFSDGAKSFSGEHVSEWLLVCCARLLRAGAARALRSDPCGADPLVRRRVRLLVHLFSNRPDARAQLCSHRSAQGYTLAAGTDRARAGEFQFARRSPARTCAAVSLSSPRSTCLHRRSERTEPSWLPSTPAAAASLAAASRRTPRRSRRG